MSETPRGEVSRRWIFISHKLHEVTAVSDRVTVLREGRNVETVVTADSTQRSLAALMVGREVAATRREEVGRVVGGPVLVLDGVSAAGDRGVESLHDVSLAVHAGEILAIAGVAGNGQRELAETITGMRAPTAGSIAVDGRALRGGDARDAIHAGVAHVPEDRLHTGVAPSLSIGANLVLKSYRGTHVTSGPMLRLGAIREHAAHLIHRYDVRGGGPELPARQLSAGTCRRSSSPGSSTATRGRSSWPPRPAGSTSQPSRPSIAISARRPPVASGSCSSRRTSTRSARSPTASP